MWLRRAIRRVFCFFAASLLISSTTRAVLVNRTIDDTYGDCETGQKPTYLPSGSVWQGASCANCVFQPDPALAFDSTWTSATYNPALQNVNMTLQFTGVAVWVFFILPQSASAPSKTDCNFTLDGRHAGNFVHEPKLVTNNAYTAFAYNVTAFNTAGLSNGQHELIISTSGVPYNVFLNFDYAIYTVDTADNATSGTSSLIAQPTVARSTSAQSTSSLASVDSAVPAVPPSRTSSSNTIGIIVGSVLGGIVLILLVFLILFFRHLRKVRANHALAVQENVSNHRPIEGFRDDMGEHYSTSDYSSQSPILSPFSDRALSTDVVGNLTPLIPVRSHQAYQPLRKSQEDLRAARQSVINQRLQSTQREINNLASMEMSRDGSERQEGAEQEIVSIREQLRQLRAQMENLQTERQSDWAMGLSNEPPPAYA